MDGDQPGNNIPPFPPGHFDRKTGWPEQCQPEQFCGICDSRSRIAQQFTLSPALCLTKEESKGMSSCSARQSSKSDGGSNVILSACLPCLPAGKAAGRKSKDLYTQTHPRALEHKRTSNFELRTLNLCTSELCTSTPKFTLAHFRHFSSTTPVLSPIPPLHDSIISNQKKEATK